MENWKDPPNGIPEDFNAFILKLLCYHGYEPCLKDSFELFSKWKNDKNRHQMLIHPYIKDAIFPTVSRHGSIEDWEFMYNRTESNLDDLSLFQLWLTKDSNLIRRILNERFFSANQIQAQGPKILNTMYLACRNNMPASMVVWNFIKTNWNQLSLTFAGVDIFGELLLSIFSNFDSTSSLHELLYAASTLEDLNDGFYYSLSLESITFNIRWSKLYLAECIKTLEDLTK